MRIDIWSDFGHPASRLGRQRLQEALATFAHGGDCEVTWHSYLLDRNAPAESNTFDAHRVLQMAAAAGLATAAQERLGRAADEGVSLGDRATLARLAGEFGLEPDAVTEMLDSDDFGWEVRSDEATAKMIEVPDIPFVVLDRKYSVTGATDVDVLVGALQLAWDEQGQAAPEREAAGCGGNCAGCACG
ncbi:MULTISPECIES: DsbA family protein [unclassified Janibacter]|uniref:DsbA family protein n=1 Tax=unclassified Janibacter TaxID=2649294 RepID=UPI003D05A320